LYRRRWRIEEAFLTVKRLLNLAYLWTGSLNRGESADPIKYLAAPENRDLGVVTCTCDNECSAASAGKRLRKKPPSATENLPATILSPANA